MRSVPPHRRAVLTVAALAAAVVVGACTAEPTPARAELAPDALAGVTVEVAQSPTCDCCAVWAEYVEDLGATVEISHVDDLRAVKQAAGVPAEVGSCHTATVEGYVVEGHVPAAAIVDLLDARPDVDGIGLAGMPAGSPGMPGEPEGPFEVQQFTEGRVSAFGDYG